MVLNVATNFFISKGGQDDKMKVPFIKVFRKSKVRKWYTDF